MKKDSEQHFRRYVACRDAGDAAGATLAWGELVGLEFDRVVQSVRLFSRGGRLSHHEQDDAVSLAFKKLLEELGKGFRETHAGAFVNALTRCTEFACLETQRRAAKWSERRLNEYADAGDDGEQRPAAPEESEVEYYDDEAALERRERLERLHEVLPLLREQDRIVIEDELAGVDVEETSAKLGIKPGALYQRRRRAHAALAKLWSDDA